MTATHLVQVAFPSQSFEVGEGGGLPVKPKEQPQAFFYGGSLGRKARRLHRLSQKLIVDFDVGSHHLGLEHLYTAGKPGLRS